MATGTSRLSQPPSQPQRNWQTEIKTKGSGLPSRVIMHGVEGVGKSSFAASAPNPIFLMARGETGLETLIDNGRVADTPHLPEIMNWGDTLSAVHWLTTAEHSYRTLVFDTFNAFERLMHEHVCTRDFGGDWGERGFCGFQRGFEIALADFRELLNAIDNLRATRKMSLIGLVHTKVSPFRNPEGLDYDRYTADMHHKTWSLLHKWADIILFANFFTEVQSDSAKAKKGKGLGGQQRVMYTVRHAAYDAKNRCGLPEEIDMGESGREAWKNFETALKAAKQQEGK